MALEQRYYKNKSDIKAFSVKTGTNDFKAWGAMFELKITWPRIKIESKGPSPVKKKEIRMSSSQLFP